MMSQRCTSTTMMPVLPAVATSMSSQTTKLTKRKMAKKRMKKRRMKTRRMKRKMRRRMKKKTRRKTRTRTRMTMTENLTTSRQNTLCTHDDCVQTAVGRSSMRCCIYMDERECEDSHQVNVLQTECYKNFFFT